MNRTVSIVCACVLAVLVVLLSYDSVSACSCSRISREEGINLAHNVFEGRVISVRPFSEYDKIPKSDYIGVRSNGLVTRIKVIKSIKGNLSGEVDILTGRGSGMCGQDYTSFIGSEVTVGAQAESLPDNVTGLCMHLALNPPELVLQRRFKTLAPIKASEFRVIDGDTIRIYEMKTDTQLVGFNVPDSRNAICPAEKALGEKAWQRLRKLREEGNLEFQFVACSCTAGTEGTEACNHGRSCGTLRSNGRDIGDILIDENLAAPFQCGATSCPMTPRPWCE